MPAPASAAAPCGASYTKGLRLPALSWTAGTGAAKRCLTRFPVSTLPPWFKPTGAQPPLVLDLSLSAVLLPWLLQSGCHL